MGQKYQDVMEFEQPTSVKVIELATELGLEEAKIKKTENEVKRLRYHLLRSARPLLERWFGIQEQTLLGEFFLAWQRGVRVSKTKQRAEAAAERLAWEKARIAEENKLLRAQLDEERKKTALVEENLLNEARLVKGLAKEASAQQKQGDCIVEHLQEAERLMLRLEGHFESDADQDRTKAVRELVRPPLQHSQHVQTHAQTPRQRDTGPRLPALQEGLERPEVETSPRIYSPPVQPSPVGEPCFTKDRRSVVVQCDSVKRDLQGLAEALSQTVKFMPSEHPQFPGMEKALKMIRTASSDHFDSVSKGPQPVLRSVASHSQLPARGTPPMPVVASITTPVLRHTPRASLPARF